ncbi:uncharacterized protein LOC109917519 [Rhincodon typus]|uniref:uncharacterized protein LOC109917519 n=1 Tax=Rhincodon typus TaxID=259920 RepID=UPI00202EF887|nr:uncharacterized protein LOC109917519 [Rhincodon typus]
MTTATSWREQAQSYELTPVEEMMLVIIGVAITEAVLEQNASGVMSSVLTAPDAPVRSVTDVRSIFWRANLRKDPIIIKKQVQGCSAMKSAVHANETAQPLAFTFIPTVQRLPVHIQVINTIRSSPWPGKQQQPSSVMNEPLHITEELPSAGVTMTDTVDRGTPGQQMEISQRWSNKGGDVSSQEAGSSEGIFKAELVFLADSYGTDGDRFSRKNEAEVNLSAKKLPLSSLSPNPFVDDKNGYIQKELIVDESKAPMLQNAEQKVDRTLQEPFFQAR